MTGLDLRRDALIEVAVLVTDAELNLVDDGIDVVIHASDELLDSMVPVVRDMHAVVGPDRAGPRVDGDAGRGREAVLDYVRSHVPQAGTAPLCGNSIATDRSFLARDMPALDEHLHYRMIDVSSIKELARRWYPAGLLGPAGQGAGPPRPGRHPRERAGARATTGAPCSSPLPGPVRRRGGRDRPSRSGRYGRPARLSTACRRPN